MYIQFFFQGESVLNGQRVWISLKTEKQKIFPGISGELEITVVPTFNKYLFVSQKRGIKKSISPIIERVKKDCSAKIVTLDGSIIGNESILDQII